MFWSVPQKQAAFTTLPAPSREAFSHQHTPPLHGLATVAAADAPPAGPRCRRHATFLGGTLTAGAVSRTLRVTRLSPPLTLSVPVDHVALSRGDIRSGKATPLRLLDALDPRVACADDFLALSSPSPRVR